MLEQLIQYVNSLAPAACPKRQVPESFNTIMSVYYPFAASDVSFPLLIFPNAKTITSFAADPFLNFKDSLNDINMKDLAAFIETNNPFAFESSRYHSMSGVEDFKSGIYQVGPAILLKIRLQLGGTINGVAREVLSDGNTLFKVQFTVGGVQRCLNYLQYYVQDLATQTDTTSRQYLVSQNPDALVMKGVPNDLYKMDLALCLAQTRREDQIVITDQSLQDSSKLLGKPYEIFKDQDKVHSLPAELHYGYGLGFISKGDNTVGNKPVIKQQVVQSSSRCCCGLFTRSARVSSSLNQQKKEEGPALQIMT